jgi:biopolymer transport protein ExbD
MAMMLNAGDGDDDAEVMVEINTTPLIDVLLVLLVMLIITIPMQTHAVRLDLPSGPPPVAAVPPAVVTLDIAADGAIRWNQQFVADRDTLEARLRAAAALTVQPELHLRPSKAVPYKAVAAVLAAAQRSGITKVGIVGGTGVDP